MSTIWFSLLNSDEKDSEELPFDPGDKHDPPLYGKPYEIGCFSVDAKSTLRFDKSQLKYLIMPPKIRDLHLNLNKSYAGAHHNFVTLRRMHRTLHWVMHNRENFPSHVKRTNFDFITVRGSLRLISCTPYLKGQRYHEQWEICASKFKGTIYFSAIDTDVDIEDNNNQSHRQALVQSWGYKFEQLMTSDTIYGECNIQSTTSQLEEHCVILKNVIGNYSLLYSAEIDAVIPSRYPGPGSGNTSCYTELKTSRLVTNEGHKYYFHRFKLVNWWAQSFFTGIPEIICGLRDDEGIVKELEILSVSKIPEKALGMWSSDACLNFCAKFLNFMKRIVVDDDPNIVYKFYYQGGDTIYCKRIIDPIPRYRVVPEWYVKSEKN